MGSLAICTVRVQHVVMRGIKEKCTQDFGAEIQRQGYEDLDKDVRINTTCILNKGSAMFILKILAQEAGYKMR